MKRRLWCISIWDVLGVRSRKTATPDLVLHGVSESATAVTRKAKLWVTNAGNKTYVNLVFATTQISMAVISYHHHHHHHHQYQ
jgi:hypothetical protein